MMTSTVHTTAGRQLVLEDDRIRTAVTGYVLPTVSWRIRIPRSQCESCGESLAPVTVQWIHGIYDADVSNHLTIRAGETVRVVNVETDETEDSR